jgi:Holliday junction resolvasome RuvABC endonuclease subunit
MKKTLCGKRDASKEEVQTVLIQEFSYLPTLLAKLAKSKHEHAYDALGAIAGVRSSDVLRLLRRML